MFNFLIRKDKVSTINSRSSSDVTSLVVNSALSLTKQIEENAKLLSIELKKLEQSRIGH